MTVLTRLLTAAMILNTWSLKAVWSADKADSDTRRPNILIAIADDQSWQHTSVAGYRAALQKGALQVALQKGTLYLSLKVECPFCPPFFVPSAVVEHQTILSKLRTVLTHYLTQTHDSRMGAQPEVWETYKRYSAIREFPPSP
jgi:hypothetical protein